MPWWEMHGLEVTVEVTEAPHAMMLGQVDGAASERIKLQMT